MYNLKEVGEFGIIDQEKFWLYQLGHCNIGKKFKSPLREDNNPSAVLFITHDGNIILHDFLLGSYNVWSYAKLMKIGLGQYNTKNNFTITKKAEKVINFTVRPWEEYDKYYWSQYYITRKQLDKYNVYPISYSWVDKKLIHTSTPDSPVYVYIINGRYKIYAPHHGIKWISTCKGTDIQGFDQLPWIGNELIITKALKDVMVYDLFDIPSIAPQSESQLLPRHIIESLLKRFSRIIVNFDDDEAGERGAIKYLEEYNLNYFWFDEGKDISGYLKINGLEKTKEKYEIYIK